MQYDLGDGVSLRHTVYDSSGTPTAATVVLTITKPDATTVTPTLSTPSTGVYVNVPVTTDATGIWRYSWSISGAVTDVVAGSFLVADPAPPPYCSVPDLKDYLRITDTSRDNVLRTITLAASRWIDNTCGAPDRQFWADPTASARTIYTGGRTFRRDGSYGLIVPDIADATGLTITGYTSTYETSRGQAITTIYSSSPWPIGSVSITARWGWPAVPDPISHAALLLSSRLFKRKDSPEGVLGNSEWGAIRVSRVDPDVMAMISPYVLPGIA